MGPSEVIHQRRHEEQLSELSEGFGKVVSALRINKEAEAEIIAEIKKQPELIKNALSDFLKDFPKSDNQELKIQVKNDEVVSSFKQIGEWIVGRIEDSNNKIVEQLKNKPTRLVAERNERNGEIDAIVIEYKK